MNDKARFELAEQRLRKMGLENIKLKNLSSKSILLKHRDAIFKEQDGMFQRICLPKTLRALLLQELETQFNPFGGDAVELKKRLRVFRHLLTDKVEKIDISALMSYCPRRDVAETITKVIGIIAAKAPNVTSVTLKGRALSLPSSVNLNNAELVNELAKLKKLVKFEGTCIDFELNDLKMLCRDQLQNLQYLDIHKIAYHHSGLADVEDFKKSFSKLRVLLYRGELRQEDESTLMNSRSFYHHCRKHLPRLKVLKEYVDMPVKDDFFAKINNELPEETSALVHLHVKPNCQGFHLAFPETTHLMIECTDWEYEENELNATLQFPKVECLHLVSVPSTNTFERFLAHYGAALRVLNCSNLACPSIKIKFRTIFEFCPNLQALKLGDHIDVVDSSVPLKKFGKLKKLQWFTPEHSSRKVSLANILAAPDLEDLRFGFGDEFSYDLLDIHLVSSLIAEGTILQKLHTFKFHLLCEHSRSWTIEQMYEPVARDFIMFFFGMSGLIKNACAHLPNLTRVSVNFGFYARPRDNIVMLNYSGSHAANFVEKREAAAYEYIGDHTLVNFLGLFNRRKYAHVGNSIA